MDWGGCIHLDGTGTERQPYHCESALVPTHQPGIVVQKSLKMEGLKSRPYVSCLNGFHFTKNLGIQPLSIVLSGIAFGQTPLIFQDCDALTISNCSFEDTFTAISVYVKHNRRIHVNINGSSFFKNNTSCLEIIWQNLSPLDNQTLVITITHANFSDNGLHKQLARGLVTVRSETKQPPSLHVQISCFHVTAVNNYGHFIHLDLPKAVTCEIYNDVILFNNTISEVPPDRKAYHVVNSLYNSITKTTYATFSNLRCSHNHLLRCIGIHSEEAHVEVQNSSFIELRLPNKNGGAMFFNSTAGGSLVLVNCTFRRNIAKGGGALFAHSQNGTLHLQITNVNFTECAAESYGCAILLGDQTTGTVENSTGTFNLIATFRGIRVHDCYGFENICDGVSLMLRNGKVVIDDSPWRNNSKSVAGTLTIINTGGHTDLTVSGCTFYHSAVNASVISVVAPNRQAGNVTIAKSTMLSQETGKRQALFITSNFRIELINLVVTSYFRAVFIKGLDQYVANSSSDAYPFFLAIYNCNFQDNFRDIVASTPDPTLVELTIKNTIFTNRRAVTDSFGLFLIVLPLRVLSFSKAIIKMDKVTFDSKPCNLIGLLFPGIKTISFKRSSFTNGVCLGRYFWGDIRSEYSVYEVSSGALSVVTSADEMLTAGCVEEGTTKDIHPLWEYQTQITFEDTLVEGNAGLITGGIYICNGYTTFKRCNFRNNFGVEHSGHVYSAYGTGRVHFEDCKFSSTKTKLTVNNTTFHTSTFLQSESGGPINVQNTTLLSFAAETGNRHAVLDIANGGYVYVDDNSTIQCPIGSQLLLDNTTHFVYTEQNNSFCRINVTVLKYSCRLCSPGFYSIQKGVSRGLTINKTIQCLQCPFGASCIQNIAAKPNFWGNPILQDPPSLIFTACPDHYCQQPKSESTGYNRCRANRNGTLCGRCSPGYSETLFSAECRKNEECKNYWFWILTILFTMALALYLLMKPPILSFLINQILWFTRKADDLEREELHRTNPHADKGYIKITFYFYQVAEILMVGSIESLLQKVPCVYTVLAAFNFQVSTINRGLGCPFPGLTASTKQLLLSGTVFLTMADIVFVYCFHSFMNVLRRKEKPPLIHYMAVVMEVLLLGYERLAESSLKLMNCVSIGSGKWLFIDANVPCMQWWQYLLLAYIAVFVFPFIIVLYIGYTKLHNASITAIEFLAACMFPLPFLIYWCCKKTAKRHGKTSARAPIVNKDVLEILHGPFRPPSNEDKGTLYWESVLIGRRFILLAFHSFIRNAMSRMVFMAAACLLMTIHHVLKNPFRDPMANRAETLSLTALSMIAMINLTKATLISFGITIDGPYRSYLETLEWFEVGALAVVPVLVTVLVTIAILSQLVRFVFFIIEQAVECCHRPWSTHWPWDEQRKPLLDIAV